MVTCRICGTAKHVDDFTKDTYSGRKAGVQTECKVCKNIRSKQHHKKTKVLKNTKTREKRRASKAMLIEHRGGMCESCGIIATEDNQCIFDFHHLHSKDVGISKLLTSSKEIQLKEVDKCILLCSNCHRIEHYKETKYESIN